MSVYIADIAWTISDAYWLIGIKMSSVDDAAQLLPRPMALISFMIRKPSQHHMYINDISFTLLWSRKTKCNAGQLVLS